MRILPLLGLLFAASAVHADSTTPAPPHEHEHSAKAPADESMVDYFWRKSDDAFHAGDYERAIGLHKAIVVLAPDDTESYGVGAWLMWSVGRGDDALAFLQTGLKENPENSEMWDVAAQQYDLQKKFADSKNAYANAVKFAPPGENSMMLRRRYAHALEHAGDLKGSLEIWRGLVKDFPADVVNKNNLARVEKNVAENGPKLMPAALVLGLVGALFLPAALGSRFSRL